MFADWFVPFALIIGTAMTIGLLLLQPRHLDQDLKDREDEQTPQSSQMEQ